MRKHNLHFSIPEWFSCDILPSSPPGETNARVGGVSHLHNVTGTDTKHSFNPKAALLSGSQRHPDNSLIEIAGSCLRAWHTTRSEVCSLSMFITGNAPDDSAWVQWRIFVTAGTPRERMDCEVSEGTRLILQPVQIH